MPCWWRSGRSLRPSALQASASEGRLRRLVQNLTRRIAAGSDASGSRVPASDVTREGPALRQASSHYRPEIDGLRAFAVIAVIINHINKQLLPSGYLGVDIFFVISGYVITASLANHGREGFRDFVLSFYERRIRRLVPALVVFVLVTSVLICVVSPEPELMLKTGFSSLFGFSNQFLYKQSTDYFAQSTELNPFTHTWSLGVEEQFYLLFPFLIWFSGFGRQRPHGPRNLLRWVGGLALVSLVAFIWLYQTDQPAAYFLMPTRFWEMAAGCLVFVGFRQRARLEQMLERLPPVLVVIAMIAVMLLPQSAAVPATLVMVLLAAIALASLKPGTGMHRLFTRRSVVFVGLISYSLYLWHWTVLAMSRWTIGISWWSLPFQLLLMLLLASLSYRYVEQTTRHRRIAGRRLLTVVGGLLGMGGAALLVAAMRAPLFSKSLLLVDPEVGAFQRGRKSQGNYVGPVTGRKNIECDSLAEDLSPEMVRSFLKDCYWEPAGVAADAPVVAFLGDSHAHQLFPIAERLARDFRLPVFNLAYANCLVPDAPDDRGGPRCRQVNQVPAWIDKIFDRPVIFVLASIADPILHFPSPAKQLERVEIMKRSFRDVLHDGNRLIVVAPNPKFQTIDNTVSDICGRKPFDTLNPVCTREHTFEADSQRNGRRVYLQALRQWTRQDGRVSLVDPFDLLCAERAGLCHASVNGVSRYWDFSHLNPDAVLSTYPLYRQRLRQILSARSGGLSPAPP